MRPDELTAGLALEGRAFDPTCLGEAARLAAGAREGIRTLQPLLQMAASASPAAESTQTRRRERHDQEADRNYFGGFRAGDDSRCFDSAGRTEQHVAGQSRGVQHV